MKILLVGGGGFIGTNLCIGLLDQGHEIRVFDRNDVENTPLKSFAEKIEWRKGDFTDERDIKQAVEDCDIVYHLLSTTIPKSSNDNPIFDIQSNLVGTIQLLQILKTSNVKKLIFVSSGGTIYGVPQTISIAETHATNPICSYGITKLAIEKYLALFHLQGGTDYAVFRLSNPYGPHQNPYGSQGAMAVFINKALHQVPIEIWGDGSVIRDYVYIEDAVKAMMLPINHDYTNKVFNLGSGQGYSINQILDIIDQVSGNKLVRTYTSARNIDVPANILNIDKIEKTLHWQPTTSIIEGVKKTRAFLMGFQTGRQAGRQAGRDNETISQNLLI